MRKPFVQILMGHIQIRTRAGTLVLSPIDALALHHALSARERDLEALAIKTEQEATVVLPVKTTQRIA
jgi:hypothetical protein